MLKLNTLLLYKKNKNINFVYKSPNNYVAKKFNFSVRLDP